MCITDRSGPHVTVNTVCRETVPINKLLASVFSLSHQDHTVVCFCHYQSLVVSTNRNLLFILFNVTLNPRKQSKELSILPWVWLRPSQLENKIYRITQDVPEAYPAAIFCLYLLNWFLFDSGLTLMLIFCSFWQKNVN